VDDFDAINLFIDEVLVDDPYPYFVEGGQP
jgi:hypothetical protein